MQKFVHRSAEVGGLGRWIVAMVLALVVVAPASLYAQTTRVRLLAGNLTSGNLQSYDPGHGTRIFQGLQPDIAMIQEFNYGDNSTAAISGWVSTAFGSTAQYVRGPSAQIPNGIVSKYPIVASGSWTDSSVSNRTFVWARIDIPGPKDLWAVSVHLLTSSATARNTEATQLVGYLNAAGIPADAFLVIGGDYNTGSDTEACLTTLSSKVVVASPYPTDQAGNKNTNAGRTKPYDKVLVNANLNAYKTAVVIGSNSHTNGLVFDSRVYTPLSAVSPVLSTDSGASNMQHMAIVKDFLVPNGGTATATATPSPTASPSPSPSASPSPSPSASPSPTPTPTLTPSLTPSPTPSPSPTAGTNPIVVISQVYGGGGNSGAPYNSDYIELFNRGNATQSLTGWSVQYASSTGTTWLTQSLSGSIAAGKYYLIKVGPTGTTGAALPTPDLTGSTSINLSGSTGKVALVSSTTALSGSCPSGTTIKDFIGYGSANCAEGSTAPTLSNTTAAKRASNGCTDANNNATDFSAGAPAPRNSATAANLCP